MTRDVSKRKRKTEVDRQRYGQKGSELEKEEGEKRNEKNQKTKEGKTGRIKG